MRLAPIQSKVALLQHRGTLGRDYTFRRSCGSPGYPAVSPYWYHPVGKPLSLPQTQNAGRHGEAFLYAFDLIELTAMTCAGTRWWCGRPRSSSWSRAVLVCASTRTYEDGEVVFHTRASSG
jgi:hypothetical protein